MAGIFCASFENYNTANIADFWNGASVNMSVNGGVEINSSTARTGSQSLSLGQAGSYCTRNLSSNLVSFVFGVAFRTADVTSYNRILVGFMDGTTYQIEVRMTTGSKLRVTRNGTTLATGTTSLVANTWHYIEFKATINGSTGSYTLKLDGVQELTASSVNTQNTANAYITAVRLHSIAENNGGAASLYDDLYFCDQNSPNGDFLGLISVEHKRPSGAGSNNDWTDSAGGTHYGSVDDTTPNDDTDYVSSATVGHIDTYAFANRSFNGDIKFLQIIYNAKRDDATARVIAGVTRHGSTNYAGDSNSLTGSYAYYTDVQDVNPGTSAAWTGDDFDAAEFGVKVVS